MAPQPEAFITMASTRPSRTSGHHASMLARICASAASCSSRWKLTAPQQPAPGAMRAPMPSASSTRMVAASMVGIMDGCTQPASISTWRACPATCGRRPGSRRSGTLRRSACGSAPRTAWPRRIAGPNSGDSMAWRSSLRLVRSAQERGTRSSTILRPISIRCPYCTPDGQVVSQLRQVRQRSRCCCVDCVGSAPSSTCLIR